ncbi:hypothetical protein KSP35_00760 [Aquihabitans sp. G128]|uniref:hypothetical protein n=1 Tax=Aquihabitans sp. G128 TaxID=2849779 RepID=UPI001C246FEA|nr:hypothetical protein [Aquihabitans sp. G128]QXC61418.1 hypothetical protein KSP35_00760 [Aquihabitans sp. G128]
MSDTSARPDLLQDHARATAATARTLRAAADRAAAAVTAHLTSGGAPDAVVAVRRCQTAADHLAELAAGVDQVGRAFRAADTGAGDGILGAGGLVTTTDRAVATALELCGNVDPELLSPTQEEAGRSWGTGLRTLDLPDQLAALAEVTGLDGYGPAFAAGALEALRADGMAALGAALRTATGRHAVSLTRADAGFADLAQLLVDAAPHRLDLGLFQALGRSAAGRDTLRQLVIDAPDLPTAAIVAVATALLGRHRGVDDDRTGHPAELLADRLERRGVAYLPDLGALQLLARDHRAAFTWATADGPERSPLTPNLARRQAPELGALGGILDGVFVESVRRGWAEPGLQGQADLPGTIQAVAGAKGSDRFSLALADVMGANPDPFRSMGAAGAYRVELAPSLVNYLAAVARSETALRRAAGAAFTGYLDEASRVLARQGPATPIDDLLGELADAHGVLVALERGAVRAGTHHDASLDTAIALGGTAASALAGAASSAAGSLLGPLAPVVGAGGRQVAQRGAARAAERWVDTYDHRGDGVVRATPRVEPYLVALAMAGDRTWAPLLVEPDVLAGLDVAGSDADLRRFRAWVDSQPPEVAARLDRVAELAPLGTGGP